MAIVRPNLSTITLKGNGLNSTIKKYRMAELIFKKAISNYVLSTADSL